MLDMPCNIFVFVKQIRKCWVVWCRSDGISIQICQIITCLVVCAHPIQNQDEFFIFLVHCSMQFITFYIIFTKVMCYCLHVHYRLFKNQRVLYGLCLIKITTKYHINVSKVFGLYMFMFLSRLSMEYKNRLPIKEASSMKISCSS